MVSDLFFVDLFRIRRRVLMFLANQNIIVNQNIVVVVVNGWWLCW
jgi:hypothetical protein